MGHRWCLRGRRERSFQDDSTAEEVEMTMETAKTCRSRRRISLLVVALAIALSVPAVAAAGQYFSGTLSPSSPAGCSGPWGAGCAESSYDYWSNSTMSKTSGDRIALGFIDFGGSFVYQTYGATANGGGNFTQTASGLGVTEPDHGFCAYYSGTSSSTTCSVS
jgi:hypothetical protein